MDYVWYRRHRAEGGTESFIDWEFQPVDSFENAPAPAKVGQVLAQKAHIELPDDKAGLANNVVHWSTGITWGVAAAMLRPLPHVGAIKSGLIAGVAAWSTSYAVLPKLGVYKPITEYDTKTLWKDLSAHLVFGSAVGVASFAFGGMRAMLRR
ncbi:MAG: hypothetical protein QOE09_3803 [Ilumatobacteraceae bacterium]|jgi:uncharacterized membrane protein YagU involved in acid resistance